MKARDWRGHLQAEIKDTLHMVRDLIHECFPKTNDKREELLRQAYVYDQVVTALIKELKDVRAELIDYGVTFDPVKAARQPTNGQEVLYEGTSVCVLLEVKSPSTRMDKGALVSAMKRRKIPNDKINDILGEATLVNRPAHVFSYVLR